MNKYVLTSKMSMTYNAGSKAVIDATSIALKCGYREFYYSWSLFSLSNNTLLRKINAFFNVLICFWSQFRISSSNLYFIQWPTTGRSVKILFDAIIRKRPRVIILIHDIDELRGVVHQDDVAYMVKMFNMSELIIAHSEAMKEYIVNKGIDASKITVMHTFDYLTTDIAPAREYSKDVVFAGNLFKSTFLKHLNFENKTLRVFTYGVKNKDLMSSIYKGKFLPDRISMLEGSWGLVWDGNSLDTCGDSYGDYLKYNSPHKVSLYIVAELPIIIWKYQALANYIRDKNLGIVISSIDEIPDKISQISVDEYNFMVECIRQEAKVLKEGGHLKHFLL